MSYWTRRNFLEAMPAAGVLAAGTGLFAQDVDSRVHEALARSISVDMHTHANIEASLRNSAAGSKQEGPGINEVSGAMKRAGWTAVSLTAAVDGPLMGLPAASSTRSSLTRDPNPGEMYAFHLKALDRADALIAANGLTRVARMMDLIEAHRLSRPAVIQDAEGADFLEGRLQRLEETFRRAPACCNLCIMRTTTSEIFKAATNTTAASPLSGRA